MRGALFGLCNRYIYIHSLTTPFRGNDLKITPEIYEDITRDDMPNSQMRGVWDDFGKEVTLRILSEYGGLSISPPKRGFLRYANRKIVEEFNSENLDLIVKKYDVSKSHVYTIAREGLRERGSNE